MKLAMWLAAGAAALALGACGERTEDPPRAAAVAPTNEPQSAPAPVAVRPLQVTASDSPIAQAIDRAEWTNQPATPQAKRDQLIRAEVLLSRAYFSPGVIDGQDGENLKNALMAYEKANGLPEDGRLDADVWQKLTAADNLPTMTDYTITEEDVAGPFAQKIPTKYEDMAKLDKLSYTTPLEALAEKFHMDEALLKALNPNADFAAAGTKIVVAAPGLEVLPAQVALVEVDKANNRVRAYGSDNRLLASYPATVGSSDMPTPAGEWQVTKVTNDPHWNYDPAKLNFGDKKTGKLDIKPGPNNPVGVVWIDLSKDTYGIHGAPEPRQVGKTASHGCVRLTNWDARQLGSAVQSGTRVVFVGAEKPRATPA
jgi:lipoprotein-anchoring transpeptidase ErfK/SrfK